MTSLFDFDDLSRRYSRLVAMSDTLKPQAEALLQEALSRGEFDRGEASRITGLPERNRKTRTQRSDPRRSTGITNSKRLSLFALSHPHLRRIVSAVVPGGLVCRRRS